MLRLKRHLCSYTIEQDEYLDAMCPMYFIDGEYHWDSIRRDFNSYFHCHRKTQTLKDRYLLNKGHITNEKLSLFEREILYKMKRKGSSNVKIAEHLKRTVYTIKNSFVRDGIKAIIEKETMVDDEDISIT
jgi:hypothetical protein